MPKLGPACLLSKNEQMSQVKLGINGQGLMLIELKFDTNFWFSTMMMVDGFQLVLTLRCFVISFSVQISYKLGFMGGETL